MYKIIFILTMLFCPSLLAATLSPNTVPYVCQGGANPQLCNSNITTDSNGNVPVPMFVPSNIQVFTSSGIWKKPAGVSKVYVKVWGGGGGGSPGGQLDGGTGGTSSFAGSTTISATGGYGSGGGTASGGSINITGGGTSSPTPGTAFGSGVGMYGSGGFGTYDDNSGTTGSGGWGGGYAEGSISVTGNVTVTVGGGGPGQNQGFGGLVIVYY